MKSYNIAIVGATGVVGQEFIKILEQRDFPVGELKLLASSRSAGKQLSFKGNLITVAELKANSFAGMDFALFSAGAGVSRQFSPIAAEAGTVVIDNSSAFRMDDSVPLIVPEVNPHAVTSKHRIIANPNCSTIQMVVAAKPLHDAVRMTRMVISTYQSVSGKGKDALDEMHKQSRDYLDGNKLVSEVFPHQIAFNMLPHIDVFESNGYTKEEIKMMNETRKIMELPNLPVTATCVRVPVAIGHCVSLNLEFENTLEPETARELLSGFDGVTVVDDPINNVYPTPAFAAGKDDVFVGRIRKDESVKHGLNLWIVSDNLRKGAALNAVQIAELLIK